MKKTLITLNVIMIFLLALNLMPLSYTNTDFQLGAYVKITDGFYKGCTGMLLSPAHDKEGSAYNVEIRCSYRGFGFYRYDEIFEKYMVITSYRRGKKL